MCCGGNKLTLSQRKECPTCKKKIGVLHGVKSQKCPFCGTELPTAEKGV